MAQQQQHPIFIGFGDIDGGNLEEVPVAPQEEHPIFDDIARGNLEEV